jgi:hypothetical protein
MLTSRAYPIFAKQRSSPDINRDCALHMAEWEVLLIFDEI